MWPQLIGWLVTTLVSAALTKPQKPQDATATTRENLSAPTASESRLIPVIWGDVLVKGLNLLWYGDYGKTPITKDYKVKKFLSSKIQQQVVGHRYHIGQDLGICRGKVELVEIRMDDRVAWAGSLKNDETISINSPNLFGGDENGGGISAIIDFFAGDENQGVSAYMVDQVGDLPAYRGVAHIVIRGYSVQQNPLFDTTPDAGFLFSPGAKNSGYIGTSATLRPISARVRSYPDRLGAAYSNVEGDANPAEIILELLTDPDYGLAIPDDLINIESFNAAAIAFHSEGLGISLMMSSTQSVESTISEIMKYIDGEIHEDLKTGEITIATARGDYDTASLMTLDPDNIISLDSFYRGAWSETANDVKVNYTDREKDFKTTSTLAQDLANLSNQAERISATFDYPGITRAQLATDIAYRELSAISYPLAKCSITANRQAYRLKPVGVFKFNWPELGITEMIMRVTKISYGTRQNPQIKIDAVQDVFNLSTSIYSKPVGSLWVDPVKVPDKIADHAEIEAPYGMGAILFEDPELSRLVYLIRRPGNVKACDVYERIGIASHELIETTELFTKQSILSAAYIRATDLYDNTGFDIFVTDDLSDIISTTEVEAVTNISNLALITSASGDEFIVFTSITDNADGTKKVKGVMRGVFDTVPIDHPAGSVIWFLKGLIESDNAYDESNNVDIRYVTSGDRGALDVTLQQSYVTTINSHAKKPLQPAYLTINNILYPGVVTFPVTLKWRHRSKNDQQAIVRQDDPAHVLDAGTTYSVKITKNNAVVALGAGINTDSFAFDPKPGQYKKYRLVFSGFASKVAIKNVAATYNGINIFKKLDPAFKTDALTGHIKSSDSGVIDETGNGIVIDSLAVSQAIGRNGENTALLFDNTTSYIKLDH